MTKDLILFLLIAFLVGSCAPTPASSTPLPTAIMTATTSPSPTQTPEPTTIPETAEQKMNRITEVEISQGATMDPSTWTHSEEGKLFAQMVLDPEGVRDILHLDNEQYERLVLDQEAYITTLREKYFIKLLSSPETSQKALETIGLFIQMQFDPSWNLEVPSSADTAIDIVKNLTPLQRLFLESVRTNISGEHMTPDIAEIIRENSNPDNQVTYSENTDQGYVLQNAGGYFGGWVERATNPLDNMSKKVIKNPMFGLDTFEGKTIYFYGNPDATSDHAALAALPVLPGGGTGMMLVRRDQNRVSRIQFVKVVTTQDAAITVSPPYPDSSGGWAAPDWVDNIQPRAVTLTTQFAIGDKDNGMNPLPEVELNKSLIMPFRDVTVFWPNEHHIDSAGNNWVQSLFLDRGIPVIGNTEEAKRGGVQAGLEIANQAINVWP